MWDQRKRVPVPQVFASVTTATAYSGENFSALVRRERGPANRLE
jgi:hypothetical protein